MREAVSLKNLTYLWSGLYLNTLSNNNHVLKEAVSTIKGQPQQNNHSIFLLIFKFLKLRLIKKVTIYR